MDEAVNPDVQMTVLWWGSGLAKTETIVNIYGWVIDENPTNIFSLWPKEESRDKFSRDVIENLIEATPALRKKFVVKKSRDTGRTIGYKKFHGGSLFLTSAGSASNFRGPRCGMLDMQEVDGYPRSAGAEGNPILLALKRCEGYSNSIKLMSGTGTFATEHDENEKPIYHSNIAEWFEKSDKRKWFVKCQSQKCRHEFILMFDQLRWERGKEAQATLHCPQCDYPHSDKQRKRMVREGRWIATAPFTGVRGYWLNGMNTLFPHEKGYKSKLHQFVTDAQTSEAGGKLGKRVWINTFKAELDDQTEDAEPAPDWLPLFDRREKYATADGRITLPEKCLGLTLGVDVHLNRLEVNWMGWGKNDESWRVTLAVLKGDVYRDPVWDELQKELDRTFMHTNGQQVGLTVGFIDAGKYGDRVFKFLNRHCFRNKPRKLFACRGHSSKPYPLLNFKISRLNKNLLGYFIGPDTGKDLLYSRLRLKPSADGQPEPQGLKHYGENTTENYFKQLTSERLVVVIERGQEIRKYRNPTNARNEALDTENYALAAYTWNRWDWEKLEKQLAKPDTKPESVPVDGTNRTNQTANVPRPRPPARFGGKKRWMGL